MSALERLPEGLMKEALREQEPEFAEERAQKWLEADSITRRDIEAFFESDGPKKVHQAKLKVREGVPTSADLNRMLRRKK